MKYLNGDEICDSGLLQEVNRQFFHPRGFALQLCGTELKIQNHSAHLI